VTWEPRFKLIGQEAWVEAGAAAEVKATGICGSGIIEAIAELYLAGVIDRDGRFAEAGPERSPRVRRRGRTGEYVLADGAQTSTGEPIVVTQSDVRAIQLGKAALYAGVKLLMQERGVDKVDRIVLAGAFGSYIDPKHAMILGLIPDCDLAKVVAVGNAAGDGARLALLNREARQEAMRLAQQAVHVQTAVAPNFQAEFVGAIALPHATDAFPHLAGILPEPAARSGPPSRRSQRRRPAPDTLAE
ncbi:MAG: ATP-binding protein, partial [Anaerolineales bacterium]|nr:ATP-binding protein [Anaerolineales bacterium]